jgi:hypothetical protein
MAPSGSKKPVFRAPAIRSIDDITPSIDGKEAWAVDLILVHDKLPASYETRAYPDLTKEGPCIARAILLAA